jgi:hypothetical protein
MVSKLYCHCYVSVGTFYNLPLDPLAAALAVAILCGRNDSMVVVNSLRATQWAEWIRPKKPGLTQKKGEKRAEEYPIRQKNRRHRKRNPHRNKVRGRSLRNLEPERGPTTLT